MLFHGACGASSACVCPVFADMVRRYLASSPNPSGSIPSGIFCSVRTLWASNVISYSWFTRNYQTVDSRAMALELSIIVHILPFVLEAKLVTGRD
jgi:hypothetical protein